MIDGISNLSPRPIGPVTPANPAKPTEKSGGAAEFSDALKAQLEQVSAMQNEADAGVQRLLTGESQNISEVFATARKAEVAFTLLMEIRNKLVDAYSELRQVRV